MDFYSLRDLARTEKPRERLAELGTRSLSDSELLAIVLRSGGKGESALSLAQNLLNKYEGFYGLNSASLEHLMEIKNIGFAKATSIKALCEIAIRLSNLPEKKTVTIKTPKEVFRLVKKDLYGKKREELILICLDTRNKFISKDRVSVGTINETLIHPREVFRQALLRNAVSIILVHNHPSQESSPSSEDILLTEKIAKAGKLLGIALVDHVIVCDREFCSLKALGIFKTIKFNGKEVKK